MDNRIIFLLSISFCAFLFPKEGTPQFISHEDLWINLTTRIDYLEQSLFSLDSLTKSINDRISDVENFLNNRIVEISNNMIELNNKIAMLETTVAYNNEDTMVRMIELANNISAISANPPIPDYVNNIARLEYNNEIWKKNFKVIKNTFEKRNRKVGATGCNMPTITLPITG